MKVRSVCLYFAWKQFYCVRRHFFHKSWKQLHFHKKVEKAVWRDAQGTDVDDRMHELTKIIMYVCSWASQEILRSHGASCQYWTVPVFSFDSEELRNGDDV